MMNSSKKFYLAAVILTATVFSAHAQNGGSAAVSLPFSVGESLTYEGKIRKSIYPGIAVADLTFTVTEPQSGHDFVVKAEARSKGTLVKWFRFSFVQQIESTFGSHDGRAKFTKKHDVQKERVRNSEAVFDHTERRVTYTETDPKDPMRPPRRIASEISPETFDLVSAIYWLRTKPMAIGATLKMTVSDSGLVYEVPVKVTARERQETVLGDVWCWRIEPQVFGPGRLIEREGSMIIWMTDDARRIPVRSQVNSSIGRVEIKLKSYKA